MRYTERIIDKYGEENIFTKYIPNNQKLKDKKLCEFEDIEEEFEIDSMEDLRDRLTKYKFLANHEMSCVDVNSYNLMLEDLNKYHSIEEELGIDLVTLMKALTICKNDSEFFAKGKSGKIIPIRGCHLCYCPTSFFINPNIPHEDLKFITLWLKDYGKTWALTKDELNR